MINEDKISKIQKKIETSISDQVKNGQQSQALSGEYKACGQFFNFKDRSQRGLHGTSSALKVLALSTDTSIKDSIPPIIKYLTDHTTIESQLLSLNDPQETVKRNENNVIKISECLHSLSYVQPGAGNKDQIIKTLAERIKQGRIENKGWDYFLNVTNPKINLLPTTFVALAVFSNGFADYKSTYDYLISEIESKIKLKDLDLTTYSILVFALYVATFYYHPEINNRTTYKKLKSLYKKLWENDYCIFNEDTEQNIEYWNEDNHYYVRIPWQLYMLALTSKFSSWNFAKRNSQKRLNSIYTNCINKDGFRYRYSGPYFSVRTHSIIFETLERIRENLKKNALYRFYNVLDHIHAFFASKGFRISVSIVSILLAGYIIYNWGQKGKFDLKQLGPEITGPILIWLILLGKKR
jgi:hypothetical protein